MKIPTVTQKTNVINNIQKLKMDMLYSAVTGNYKGYKTSVKAYAKEAVKHLEILPEIKSPSISVPLFTQPKTFFKMAKIWFLDKFRIKTPEEKQLKEFARRYKFEQKIKNQL